MKGVVDVHVHCSDRADDALRSYARLNRLEYNLEELLTLMKQNGVRRSLLLGSILEGGGFLPAGETLRLCEKSGDKLLPVLTAVATRKGVKESVSIAKEQAGYVRGFKIMLGYEERFASDAIFSPLYSYAEEAGLPVMFHTGDTATASGSLVHSHPLTLDLLANRRPGLKIVACHCGNPWISDTAELAYKHPNLYADISGLVTGASGSRYADRYLESVVRKLNDAIFFAGGTDKLLFGTDYPVETHATALELVGRLEIESDDREKILSKNAERLFSL